MEARDVQIVVAALRRGQPIPANLRTKLADYLVESLGVDAVDSSALRARAKAKATAASAVATLSAQLDATRKNADAAQAQYEQAKDSVALAKEAIKTLTTKAKEAQKEVERIEGSTNPGDKSKLGAAQNQAKIADRQVRAAKAGLKAAEDAMPQLADMAKSLAAQAKAISEKVAAAEAELEKTAESIPDASPIVDRNATRAIREVGMVPNTDADTVGKVNTDPATGNDGDASTGNDGDASTGNDGDASTGNDGDDGEGNGDN